jgi:hypothetical protein
LCSDYNREIKRRKKKKEKKRNKRKRGWRRNKKKKGGELETSSLNLPSLAGWEVCKVQGKPKIGKVEESNLDPPFYFSFFSKFLNLRCKFSINSNLQTFFLIIHFRNFIQFLNEFFNPFN